MLQISANELGVFKACSDRPIRQSRLADLMSLSDAAVSQIAGRLVDKGLCRRSMDGLENMDTEHAAALASALSNGTIPEWALVGGNLPLLLSLLRVAKSVDRVAMETMLARGTVKTYERRMREHALTVSEGGLRLAPKNHELLDFLEHYAHGCAIHLSGRADPMARLSWNDGMQFICRSERENADGDLKLTGLSFLAEQGLPIGGWYSTYHGSYWKEVIGVEQACVHAHLNEPDSSTVITYCILTLMTTSYDREKLLEEARLVEVERVMVNVLKAVEGEPVSDPLIIPREELEEIGVSLGRWK